MLTGFSTAPEPGRSALRRPPCPPPRGRGRRPRRLVGMLAALVLLPAPGLVSDAKAVRIRGGGPAKSDCYSEFEVGGVTSTGTRIECTDGDACDADHTCDGTCTFDVGLCLNQTDVATCTPAPLTAVTATAKCGTLTVPALGSNECAASAGLAVRTKKGGTKPGTCAVKVVATSSGKPKKDKDTITLVCRPHQGSCTPQLCGNGVVDTGEQCDPNASPTGCQDPRPNCVNCSCTTSCPGFSGIEFDVGQGTQTCGQAALASGAVAPLSGEVRDAGGAKLADLGLGCLYFGGGGNNVLVPGPFTNGFPIQLDAHCSGNQVQLAARSGPPQTCTKGPGPGRHCISGHNIGAECTADANCGGSNPAVGVCAYDANCYFGPGFPIPNPNKALNVCSMNVLTEDLTGTADVAAGTASLALKFTPHLYLTGLSLGGDPCPKCVGGTCQGGKNDGGACTAVGSTQTAAECPPKDEQYIGAFAIDFSPFSTGSTSKSDPAGNFCAAQRDPGAFGKAAIASISETGAPVAGGLTTTGGPATLSTVFCVPASGSPLFDPVASFPGPGAYSLVGTMKLLP